MTTAGGGQGIVGIVIVIFLVVFLIVDATCCYINHCGLLMSIAVKLLWRLFVWDIPLFVWDNTIFKTFMRGEVKLKGFSTPRGSLQMGGVKKEAEELTEVTCDKYVQSNCQSMPALATFQISM